MVILNGVPHAGQADRISLPGASSEKPSKPNYRFTGTALPTALDLLRARRQWVTWRYLWDERKAKWQKPPCDVRTGIISGATDPAHWGTFDEALATARRLGMAGIGFALSADDDLTGIDLDDCIEPVTGKLSPLAAEVVGFCETYAEISPSGTGIRIFARGKIAKALKADDVGVEMYGTGRYLTGTGNQLPGTPDEIRPAPCTIARLVDIVERVREQVKDERARSRQQHQRPGADANFFQAVNVEALKALDAWVPALLPKAVKQATGGWRVSSADLGRGHEEDLSIHPSGIRDFGLETRLTPIDLVLEHSNHTAASAAALWVCQKIGIDPGSLGWRGSKSSSHMMKHSSASKVERGGSQADTLIACAEDIELFRTPDDEAYARLDIDGHYENHRIGSKFFTRWLLHEFFKQTERAPNSESVRTALKQIEARAFFQGACHPVHLRLAGHAGNIYVDLCDDRWRAIEITQGGWQIIAEPPVRFVRSRAMQAFPDPQPGGNLIELRHFVKAKSKDDFTLLIAWLLGAYHPDGPYPVLALHGEQGSAKSTTATLLRTLADPSSAPLRTIPREERDLFIQAKNARVLAFDNVSSIPEWLSDALCRIATGGGFSTRQLFTDTDEQIIAATRPILLTSIEACIDRADLADRALPVELARIDEGNREPLGDIMKRFENELPKMLGSLCNAISHGLRHLPDTKLNSMPRMADFARWVVACELALWREARFIDAYRFNRADNNETLIDADLVATAVRGLMRQRHETQIVATAEELLGMLNNFTDAAVKRDRQWPKNTRALGGKLKRAAPALRNAGFTIHDDGHRGTGNEKRKVWTVEAPASPQVGEKE
jgi:hypothetical protein